ncbi:mediator of RNA polymerase II transcription subunit 36a-like protein, partial [Trifolium pratense]
NKCQSNKFICSTASLPGNLTLVLLRFLLRNSPPPPTPSFNVPQRPYKPQPCIILPHPRIPGVYVAGDHDDDDDHESRFLYTRNLVPGVKSFDQDVVFSVQDEDGGTVEYREWDPFKSRLAAAILSGSQNIWIKPGSRVLVVRSRDDAQFGITISHISDIVGPQGMVYVVEESNGNSLLDMADENKRFNIVPIVYTSPTPWQYRMLINIVDVLFAALDRPIQVHAAYSNAMFFLKTGGHYMLYVQGNCIESTNRGDGVFSSLTEGQQVQFQRMERVTLEPFDRDHAYVSGVFRTLEIAKIDQSCLVSDEFWTSKKLHRSPEGRICLYEQLKNLPVYLLFESSCGYLVFRALDVYNVERNYVASEVYIKRFDEFFQLVACHAFLSDEEALKYLTADGNGALEKAQVDLARIYSRQKLDSPDKGKLPRKRGDSLASFPTRRNPKKKARADTKT